MVEDPTLERFAMMMLAISGNPHPWTRLCQHVNERSNTQMRERLALERFAMMMLAISANPIFGQDYVNMSMRV